MELGVKYLLEAGVKTDSNLQILTRALVIYHNFMRCVGDAKYDPATVAAAALHLSNKLAEKELDMNGLILLFYYMVNGTATTVYPGSVKFDVLKKSLLTVEYVMHRMLEFNLKFSIAHQFLLPFLNVLLHRAKHVDGFLESMSETCVKFMSDFYIDRMCLDYKPEDIAIACIDAALHFHGFMQHLEMLHPWHEGFSIGLPEEKVQEMKRGLLRLYKNLDTRRQPPQVRNRARRPPQVRNRARQTPQVRNRMIPFPEVWNRAGPSSQVEDILSPEENTN